MQSRSLSNLTPEEVRSYFPGSSSMVNSLFGLRMIFVSFNAPPADHAFHCSACSYRDVFYGRDVRSIAAENRPFVRSTMREWEQNSSVTFFNGNTLFARIAHYLEWGPMLYVGECWSGVDHFGAESYSDYARRGRTLICTPYNTDPDRGYHNLLYNSQNYPNSNALSRYWWLHEVGHVGLDSEHPISGTSCSHTSVMINPTLSDSSCSAEMNACLNDQLRGGNCYAERGLDGLGPLDESFVRTFYPPPSRVTRLLALSLEAFTEQTAQHFSAEFFTELSAELKLKPLSTLVMTNLGQMSYLYMTGQDIFLPALLNMGSFVFGNYLLPELLKQYQAVTTPKGKRRRKRRRVVQRRRQRRAQRQNQPAVQKSRPLLSKLDLLQAGAAVCIAVWGAANNDDNSADFLLLISAAMSPPGKLVGRSLARGVFTAYRWGRGFFGGTQAHGDDDIAEQAQSTAHSL